MSDTIEGVLEATFVTERPRYVAFTANIAGLLATLLHSQGFEAISIEPRTKEIESFADKIRREDKQGKYQQLGDITDLSGIRIVTYYQDDVRKICSLIESNFDIDRENSVDKNESIEADRFGYLSVHYVVSHNSLRKELPENQQFAGMKAEIQVRTVLQHAWAVLDRRLRYNNEKDIPRAVRRKFFRISALLEAADESLSEIGKQVSELREKYQAEFQKGDLKTEINLESLVVFVDQSRAMTQLRAVRDELGLTPTKLRGPPDLSGLADFLNRAGLKQIEQVETTMSDFSPHAPDWLKRIHASMQAQSDARIVLSDESLIRFPVLVSLEKELAEEIYPSFKAKISEDGKIKLEEILKAIDDVRKEARQRK